MDYEYFSCRPPSADEVADYLCESAAEKVLFYVMGTSTEIDRSFYTSKLAPMLRDIEVGNTYRYVIEGPSLKKGEYISPNYELLDQISGAHPALLDQINAPIIAEIETGTGCNTPTCYFCIESARSPKIRYRSANSIIKQISTLYDCGVRHFRLGRQPNFYHFARKDVSELERLLAGIREACPDIKMLHIDNVNMYDVVGSAGRAFTKLIVEYCTSGNIAPFGIESFDNDVRKESGVIGSAEQVMEAVSIINEYGAERGLDGLPRLLPGINLIYGLRGQIERTHAINMQYLTEILDTGLMTRRLYYRKATRPTGITFSAESIHDETAYRRYFDDIVQNFVLPMQSVVYPAGHVVRDLLEVRNDVDASYLRTFGTCSIRYRISNRQLRHDRQYDVRVLGNVGYRELECEIIREIEPIL